VLIVLACQCSLHLTVFINNVLFMTSSSFQHFLSIVKHILFFRQEGTELSFLCFVFQFSSNFIA
jgi:hypothetical protein